MEWKKPRQDTSGNPFEGTEMGDLLEKMNALKDHLEDLIEKDKDAIRKVEREVDKIISQKKGRVRDDQ